ncbi:hypothetical protein C8F04DRAFT_1402742 [Mycena alexandri]|uniref:Uncharacterized protein n=1 Tax=Mycena alexandri TaxID=1745969 RepID=A0AAD6WPD2_9AGAR|nr:hypothetical protein C8F04DRAFT_1403731 [Mycena alexandri]KAJ7021805.1 hypothetical protein C8F04DRAFT_1402742 [Mycena alexandri]
MFSVVIEEEDEDEEEGEDVQQKLSSQEQAPASQDSQGGSQELGVGVQEEEQEGDEEEQETVEEKKERKKAAARLKVIKRAQGLIGGIAAGKVLPSELFKRISHPDLSLKAPQQEDLALGWILRGFEGGSWSNLVGKQDKNVSASTIEFLQLSARLDTTPNLTKRDTNLVNSVGKTQASTYFLDVIHKMETIKCAKEWLAHTGVGSGNYKQEFNTKLFQQAYPRTFRDLSDAAKHKKMVELKNDFRDFKKAREELITARNRLVCCWDYFGTGILIHPFFTAPNLGEKRGKTFKSLLDTLNQLVPPAEAVQGAGRTRFQDVEKENRNALHGLMKALCADAVERTEVKKYIDDFYAAWPSRIRP